MPAAGKILTDRQRLHWLRLIRTDNVGPATFRTLINRFGSAEAALAALPGLAQSGGASKSFKIFPEADARAELDAMDAIGARLIALGEPEYPPLLRHMDHPPPLLAIKGRTELFSRPAVAIVGARNASTAGTRMARMLASDLGQAGNCIVSGLARGIDAAAHHGSLATGTIAVLAGGLDRPYPPENASLCSEIADRGIIVSEMPIGWEPRSRDFPRRNRLVAGLCLGLVVVEAAQRSGSLISARLAAELGRLVFAVPGSPLDPRAAGTNSLLKEGATLVTEPRDVIDALTPLAGPPATRLSPLEEPPYPAPHTPVDDDARARILEALSPVPTPLDELVRHTGLSPAQLSELLLELDLAGRLERHSGGSVSLVFPDS